MCLSTSTAFVWPVKLLLLTLRLVLASASSGSLHSRVVSTRTRAPRPGLSCSLLWLVPDAVLAPRVKPTDGTLDHAIGSGGRLAVVLLLDELALLLLARVQPLKVDPARRALQLAQRNQLLERLPVRRAIESGGAARTGRDGRCARE
mgnify:CR=1 FL=1